VGRCGSKPEKMAVVPAAGPAKELARRRRDSALPPTPTGRRVESCSPAAQRTSQLPSTPPLLPGGTVVIAVLWGMAAGHGNVEILRDGRRGGAGPDKRSQMDRRR
jgi:hypothetical protein